MDPVSAIVAAIAFAGPIIGKELIGAGVKDAYAKLKQSIASRFKRGAAVAALEEAPESQSAREALAGALRETGAADDGEIRALAAQLLEAIKALPASELQEAGIEIGRVEGARNAIVEGNVAAGSIRIDSVVAHGGDAVVRGNRAGVGDPAKKA